jgi:hypothetical protein
MGAIEYLGRKAKDIGKIIAVPLALGYAGPALGANFNARVSDLSDNPVRDARVRVEKYDNGALLAGYERMSDQDGIVSIGASAGKTGVFNAEVDVYNIWGQIVRRGEVDPSGVFRWDGRDNSGRSVGNGVYLYNVKSENEGIKSGKIAYVGGDVGVRVDHAGKVAGKNMKYFVNTSKDGYDTDRREVPKSTGNYNIRLNQHPLKVGDVPDTLDLYLDGSDDLSRLVRNDDNGSWSENSNRVRFDGSRLVLENPESESFTEDADLEYRDGVNSSLDPLMFDTVLRYMSPLPAAKSLRSFAIGEGEQEEIEAPRNVTVTDVPNDNGGFVDVTWEAPELSGYKGLGFKVVGGSSPDLENGIIYKAYDEGRLIPELLFISDLGDTTFVTTPFDARSYRAFVPLDIRYIGVGTIGTNDILSPNVNAEAELDEDGKLVRNSRVTLRFSESMRESRRLNRGGVDVYVNGNRVEDSRLLKEWQDDSTLRLGINGLSYEDDVRVEVSGFVDEMRNVLDGDGDGIAGGVYSRSYRVVEEPDTIAPVIYFGDSELNAFEDLQTPDVDLRDVISDNKSSFDNLEVIVGSSDPELVPVSLSNGILSFGMPPEDNYGISVISISARDEAGNLSELNIPYGIVPIPDVEGRVTDTLTDIPLEGALVKMGDKEALTDSDGRYKLQLDRYRFAPRTHPVTITKDGYVNRESGRLRVDSENDIRGMDYDIFESRFLDFVNETLRSRGVLQKWLVDPVVYVDVSNAPDQEKIDWVTQILNEKIPEWNGRHPDVRLVNSLDEAPGDFNRYITVRWGGSDILSWGDLATHSERFPGERGFEHIVGDPNEIIYGSIKFWNNHPVFGLLDYRTYLEEFSQVMGMRSDSELLPSIVSEFPVEDYTEADRLVGKLLKRRPIGNRSPDRDPQ